MAYSNVCLQRTLFIAHIRAVRTLEWFFSSVPHQVLPHVANGVAVIVAAHATYELVIKTKPLHGGASSAVFQKTVRIV